MNDKRAPVGVPEAPPGQSVMPNRQDYFEEPTRLERLICAQFRRGVAVPLAPQEHARMMAMSLEQRCDYIAKIVVWTARDVIKHIKSTDVES
jgi:hypothetical protein